jgi:hypothetical protein
MAVPYRLTCCALASVVVGLLAVPGAAAQESREAEIASEKAQKAAQLKPYEPTSAERWVVAFRREFLEEPSGFYPYFASVYSGGGFTLGAGYRQFFGDRTHWDVKGLYSLKNYKFMEFTTDSWGPWAGPARSARPRGVA